MSKNLKSLSISFMLFISISVNAQSFTNAPSVIHAPSPPSAQGLPQVKAPTEAEAPAKTNVDQIRKDVAKLEKNWDACDKFEGETYRDCIRKVATSAIDYVDKYFTYYMDVVSAQPDALKHLKRLKSMTISWGKYQEKQCAFEATMSGSTQEQAFAQLCRCTFRTYVDRLYSLDSHISN